MKNKWVVVCSVLALAMVQGSGQTSGGGGASGGGTSGGGTAGGAATSGGSVQNNTTVNPQNQQNQPTRQVPPGLQNRGQLPPGLQNREQLPPGLQREPLPHGLSTRTNQFTAGSTNQVSFSNSFAGNTNQFGDTNLSPTGRSGTNRVFSTNTFNSRQFDRSRFRDVATTATDQNLLIKIKQTITTEISVGTSAGASWIPIHIAVDSGRVTLLGLVGNPAQAQQIQSLVAGMPGVASVQNALSTLPQDQALNENDRVILGQIRQVIPLSTQATPWTPVVFDVRQGTVAITGIVPTIQESQRIETFVRQVPGVVQASNTLIVDTQSGTSATSTTTVPQQ